MPIQNNENRRETRRPLKMPVTFFLRDKKEAMSDYFFGCTKNVGICGVCVYARPHHIPKKGSRVTLMLAPETKSRFAHTDIPLEIKGRVAWSSREQQTFGIRFT